MADFSWLSHIIFPVIQALIVLVALALTVAFLIYFERKVIALSQLRVGPSIAGPFGLLQSFADLIKSLGKETIIPTNANKILFLLAPVLTVTFGMGAWAIIPFSETMYFANVNVGVLFIMAMSALGVYGIILAGWASNSRYAFFGAIRSASQMISYEISIGFSILCVALLSDSLNLIDIVNAQKTVWFALPLFPMFVIFFVSILAETNRHPFDLPEAEQELVSGYNVEYSAMSFALFFLTEYANMLFMSVFCAIMFLGGWLPPADFAVLKVVPGFAWFFAKVLCLVYVFILCRTALPRYRYDQLMKLGWQVFLPISMGCFVLTACYKAYILFG